MERKCPWIYMQGGHALLGAVASQTFSGLYWLNRLFEEKRAVLKSCIELGTASGALSTLFGCWLPGATRTCDIADGRGLATQALHDRLGISFVKIDLLTGDPVPCMLQGMPHPLFLFCDNGGKEQEFLMFLPHLKSGDIIGTHDYRTGEFNPEKPEIASAIEGLKPWRQEELDADTSYLGIWEVP